MVKALVADNNGFVREQLKQNLSKAGIVDFVVAVDGVEAVKVFEKESPALVVMDIAIDRLTGIEAARKIKEINSHTKIILVSILGNDLEKEALEAGANVFLQSPFEKGKLIEAVKELVF